MINRIIGVLTLNVNTYEEIEADKNATIQSFSIVVLSSIVTAIILKPDTGFSLPNFISAIIIGIFLWGLWALVAMFVGTKLLPTQETSSNTNINYYSFIYCRSMEFDYYDYCYKTGFRLYIYLESCICCIVRIFTLCDYCIISNITFAITVIYSYQDHKRLQPNLPIFLFQVFL